MNILDYIPSITVYSLTYYKAVIYDNVTDYINNQILNIKSTGASDVIISNFPKGINVRLTIDCMSINGKSMAFNTYAYSGGHFVIGKLFSVSEVLDVLTIHFPEFKYIPLQ